MVKLTGPATAQQASGSLGEALIFSHTKRGAYLKRHKKPKQPRTPAQVAMRAMMGFLSSQWANLSPGDQATWTALAQQDDISEFNAYQAYNCDRWRRFLAPSMTYPAPLGGSFSAAGGLTATPFPAMVRLAITITIPRNAWAYPIYRIPTAGTAKNWNYLVGFQIALAAGLAVFDDRPLAIGTYHYRWGEFLTTGNMWSGDLYRTATVTS